MEVDRIPLAQLPSRYNIARSALYTRLKDLEIEPVKLGRKAFINNEQLQRLDDLHEHIQSGGITSDFLKDTKRPGQSSTEQTTEESKEKSSFVQDSPGHISLAQPETIVALVETVIKRLVPKVGSRLSYLQELEEAYEKNWLLSTSEVAELLGLSPKTVREYGQRFSDAGFLFTRAGTRTRGEIAWKVSKDS